MSIILNALRKSEQERQLREPENLGNKILNKQEIEQKKPPIWLFTLVIVNLFFLAYFLWGFIKDNKNKEESTVVIQKNQVFSHTKPESQQKALSANKSQFKNNLPLTVPVHKTNITDKGDFGNKEGLTNSVNIQEQPLSIANQMAKLLTNPQPIASKKVITTKILKKQESINHLVLKSAAKLEQQKPITKQTNKLLTNYKKVINSQEVIYPVKNPVRQTDIKNRLQTKPEITTANIKSKVASKHADDNNPVWLSALPNEFRRTVPGIKINVYVYLEEKEKRFIMINMVKHVSGQDIGEGMILKEIRMNSLVVEFNNKIFQIKR